MWLKLTGAALVALTGALAGHVLAAPLSRRPAELADLQAVVAVLESEVGYGMAPLPEALRRAAAVGPLAARFCAAAAARLEAGAGITAGEALQGALAALLPHSALTAEDAAAFRSLCSVLGSTGREDQLRHLALCRQQLARCEGLAARRRERYERMVRYLGTLGGVALAIILM